jgi:uncharacterized protein YjiS (DUF1127 family)
MQSRPRQRAAVLGPVKAKPVAAANAASLDRPCARRLRDRRPGRKNELWRGRTKEWTHGVAQFTKNRLSISSVGLEVVMSSIRRLTRATTTWLTGPGRVNDLTTFSDRDLRDVGLVRQQIGKNCKLFVLT